MLKKSTKSLSAIFATLILSTCLLGIPIKKAEARPLPAYIIVPIVIQATGYALPRISKKLTPQQQEKLQAIRSYTYQQIGAVLTKAQHSYIVRELQTSQGRSRLIKSLQLTPNQKARIQSIMQTSRQKMQLILSE